MFDCTFCEVLNHKNVLKYTYKITV